MAKRTVRTIRQLTRGFMGNGESFRKTKNPKTRSAANRKELAGSLRSHRKAGLLPRRGGIKGFPPGM